MSSSSSQSLSGSGREGISSSSLPPGLVLSPLHCQAVFRSFYSAQELRAKTSPVAEVSNEASTLGTPVLALPIPLSPVAGLAQASRSLGRNSHRSSSPICWQDKTRQGKVFFSLFLLTDRVLLKWYPVVIQTEGREECEAYKGYRAHNCSIVGNPRSDPDLQHCLWVWQDIHH